MRQIAEEMKPWPQGMLFKSEAELRGPNTWQSLSLYDFHIW